MAPLLVISVLLMFILAAAYLGLIRHEKKGSIEGLNVPPGSFGWPVVGETFQYTKLNRADAVEDFAQERIRRYGKIFRTHLFGRPTIASADTDLSRFMLLNDGRLFEPELLRSVLDVLGRTIMPSQSGERHRFLKNVSIAFMGPNRLGDHFLAATEECVLRVLDSWAEDAAFPVVEESSKVAFHLIAKKVLGLEAGDGDVQRLRQWYESLRRGLLSVPLNLPGFSYRKAVKARKEILKMAERLMEERRAMKEAGRDGVGDGDFLGMVLENGDLTREEIGDFVIMLLVGGLETSSIAIALAIYYLHGCPESLRQLREEHLEIDRKKKKRGHSCLSWEDYKEMDFTQCVISETLRLGNIARNTARKARANIQFKGYDIPKDWMVMAIFTSTHFDNSVYEKPYCFHPWRWQSEDVSATKAENYMPFSLGAHRCAGMALAKMEIAVFLHYLVLKYDWELAEPDHPSITVGFTNFPNGLPIKVHALSSTYKS